MAVAWCVRVILLSAVSLGLVTPAMGYQEQPHTLAEISDIVQNNQESVVRLASTLNTILEAKRRRTCTQADVSTREQSICEVMKEGAISAAAIFSSLELSLAELNLHLLNNTCGQTQASSCSESEWECESGECILLENFCDGSVHCQDQSDERPNCMTNKCPEGKFKCQSGRSCVPNEWVCDGDVDCPDASDENCLFIQSSAPPPSTASSLSTPLSKNKCPEGEFKCQSGRSCVPNEWVCDGDVDCPDASDENCLFIPSSAPPPSTASSLSTPLSKNKCLEREFKCVSDMICIPTMWVCDGENDCLDASDEESCWIPPSTPSSAPSPSTPPPKTVCPEGNFRCRLDNICIPVSWVCDTAADCLDGTDEENCSVTSTTIATDTQSTPPSTGGDECEGHTCSHLCLPSPEVPGGYTCACPNGMILLRDRRTCVAHGHQDTSIKIPV